MRRPILAVLLCLSAVTAVAQRRDGTYKPGSGTPVPWSINEHQTLIWGGQPYIPFGVRIDGTPVAVAAAKAAGITDVIVDLPANGIGWAPVIAALNQARMRFLVRIDSLAPMARGYAVEPQGYRIVGITKRTEVKLQIPGASSAYVVLAEKADGTIAASERVQIINGDFDYTAKPGPELEHVLLIYPEMTSMELTDYWEDLDNERDELLSTLKKHPLGPGLRGFVNPMGRGLAIKGRDPIFVPTSPYFRMEFAAFLQSKYKNAEGLAKAWSLKSSALLQQDEQKHWVANFKDFAKLVPLWSGNRGISNLLDPDSNTMYPCDDRFSKIWSDISEVIATAEDRRFAHLVPDIRELDDVPVLQDWLGWSAPYESQTPAIDGVGMRAYGTTESTLAETGSRAASSLLRWQTHGWLVTTDLDMGSTADAATQLPETLDELTSMGAKGVFVRSDAPALLKAVAAEAVKRSSDMELTNSSPLPIFFPENACNPAVAQKLPGDHWWLPTPSEGNRVDLGSRFYAYRSGLNDGTLAIWTPYPGRYRLLILNPKAARFQSLDGSDPKPKAGKGYIDVTLSQFPLLITGTFELPVPEVAYLETVQRFKLMLGLSELKHGNSEEMEMYFTNAMNGFQRNPGGSYYEMRLQYWRLANFVAPYTWIEAEKYADTSFSEVVKDPGCSGGQALTLKTMVPPGPNGYFAEYHTQIKSKEEQEVWLAAKIPSERRDDISVVVGERVMRVTGEPVSLYGDGFGWYKLGSTTLTGAMAKIRLQVATAGNAEIAFDAILLTPRAFKPNGVLPPDPVNFEMVPTKPVKNSKRKGSGAS